jgi:hypothetical protein
VSCLCYHVNGLSADNFEMRTFLNYLLKRLTRSMEPIYFWTLPIDAYTLCCSRTLITTSKARSLQTQSCWHFRQKRYITPRKQIASVLRELMMTVIRKIKNQIHTPCIQFSKYWFQFRTRKNTTFLFFSIEIIFSFNSSVVSLPVKDLYTAWLIKMKTIMSHDFT